MTNNDDLTNSNRQADEALARAKEMKNKTTRIAEGWRKSRTDNNFRALIRQLASGGSSG